jgi:hypothetical protein
MWCIGELTAEYRRRMYELLELYARPYDPREPVICLDEKCKQLLRETRPALPAKIGTPAGRDTAAQDPVPLHAQPCELVEHGRDRGENTRYAASGRRTLRNQPWCAGQ